MGTGSIPRALMTANLGGQAATLRFVFPRETLRLQSLEVRAEGVIHFLARSKVLLRIPAGFFLLRHSLFG